MPINGVILKQSYWKKQFDETAVFSEVFPLDKYNIVEFALFVWAWSFIWMQISEVMKSAEQALEKDIPTLAGNTS